MTISMVRGEFDVHSKGTVTKKPGVCFKVRKDHGFAVLSILDDDLQRVSIPDRATDMAGLAEKSLRIQGVEVDKSALAQKLTGLLNKQQETK